MPHFHRTTAYQANRGFSLIELMISMTIGLVIVIAAMSAYVGSSTASKVSDAQNRMNEDAQAALSVLAQQIRMAGTNPVQSGRADAFRHNPVFDPTYVGGTVTAYGTTTFTATAGTATYSLSAFAIRGCDGTFTNILTLANLDSFSNCGTSTLPDSIGISYEGDKYNTASSVASAGDCVGNTVPTITASGTTTTPALTATYWVVDNRFYIANPSSTPSVPNLYCKGNGGSAQPLVENVENMQFLYGTVSTTNTSATATVAGYLTATEVVALAPTANTAGYSTAWGKVLSVRICVVVRSENPVVTETASSNYYNCDGALDSTNTDRRLRRAYTTTVVLRNRRL
jgi:type IV pilus assembly protein PilW